jgi:hypothetical protein
MSDEAWAYIPGFENLYKISNHGNVKSLARKRWTGGGWQQLPERNINGSTRFDRYKTITLCKGNMKSKHYLHRLVATVFLKNPHSKRTVNHKDGNPSNNHVGNLEWASYQENHIHAYRVLGRRHSRPMTGKTGKLHPNSVAVYQISNGVMVAEFGSMREAERETGISNSRISLACSGGIETAGGYTWRLKEAVNG